MRASAAEAALLSGADAAEAGKIAASHISPVDDIHASGAYRTQVTAVIVRRAIEAALKEARS